MAAGVDEREGLGRQIERRSIDYVPEDERHGKVWHQGPFWFLGNFQFFTITIGFIGPGLGLSLGWTILAGTLGILFGTLFMAFHAIQGAQLGLPQMVQSRRSSATVGCCSPWWRPSSPSWRSTWSIRCLSRPA